MAIVPTTNPPASKPSRQVNRDRCGSSGGGVVVWAFDMAGCVASSTATASHVAEALQRDFTRRLEVGQEHLLRLLAECLIFDDGVELVVDGDAERVHVGRTDAHPATVD